MPRNVTIHETVYTVKGNRKRYPFGDRDSAETFLSMMKKYDPNAKIHTEKRSRKYKLGLPQHSYSRR